MILGWGIYSLRFYFFFYFTTIVLLFNKVYYTHVTELFLLYKTELIVFSSNLFFFYFWGLERYVYPGGKKQYFRHLLFSAFHRGQKATEAIWDICNVFGEDVIDEFTVQKWYTKFKNGHYIVVNAWRSERPSEFVEERLKAFLKKDSLPNKSWIGRKKLTEIIKRCAIIFIQWALPKNEQKIAIKFLLNISSAIEQDQPYSFSATPGLMLHKSFKPHSKSSNGWSFRIRSILQILHCRIIAFSAPCRTIWGAVPSTSILKTG